MLDITKDQLREQFKEARAYEILFKQRVSVYEKATEKLVAAYRIHR